MFHDVICSILCFLCRCIICWCGRFLGFLRAWQEICVCCYCAVGEVYQKTFRATVFFLATTPRKILLHSSYHLSQQWFSATSKPPRTWSSWMQIWCRCWSSCNLRTARPETTRCHHALIKMISVTSPQPATSNLVERPLVAMESTHRSAPLEPAACHDGLSSNGEHRTFSGGLTMDIYKSIKLNLLQLTI